jgi:hypothetical protein
MPRKAVLGVEHLVAGALEAHPDQPPHVRFVVDHEHPRHRAERIPRSLAGRLTCVNAQT